jgi:hypothetical protein
MAEGAVTVQSAAIDDFVSTAIQQYRQKLLDLSSRNPLISFRHSERSRSHIRVIDEVPEALFSRLSMSRQMTFDHLPSPELIPPDERAPLLERAINNARRTDELYKEKLAEFGPNPSDRQTQKADRELRNRVRIQLGLAPYDPTLDPKKRAAELASRKPVPVDSGLSAVLLDWRGRCPYNQETDYVFASPEKDGTQPVWPSSAMSKHIRPAAKRAGIVKHVRWQVFRHSFTTLLNGNGENVKTVQESLRHADSKVTLDTYTQGLMPVKRQAQRKVIQMIVPIRSHASEITAVGA